MAAHAAFGMLTGVERPALAATIPGTRLAFGGPGKTPAEIAAAVRARVFRFHVESPHELRHLDGARRPRQFSGQRLSMHSGRLRHGLGL